MSAKPLQSISVFTMLGVLVMCAPSVATSHEAVHLRDRVEKSASEEAPPPLPAGVAELSFDEFYRMPIGPRGLEPTPKLMQLNGARVRLIGHMVREEEPIPGLFMLAPMPVQLAELADGPADQLPASTVFVHMPPQDREVVLPYRPGRWALVGTLETGAREEANGRISYVRLKLGDDAKAETVAETAAR